MLNDEFDYVIDILKEERLIKEEVDIQEGRDDLINIAESIATDIVKLELKNNQGESFSW